MLGRDRQTNGASFVAIILDMSDELSFSFARIPLKLRVQFYTSHTLLPCWMIAQCMIYRAQVASQGKLHSSTFVDS